MKRGRYQAKDISDATALDAVRRTQGMHGVPTWSTLWDVCDALVPWPAKVVRAKLASLVRRGLLRGVARDRSRGDFEFPPVCGKYLGDNDATCPQLTCVRPAGHAGGCDNVRP